MVTIKTCETKYDIKNFFDYDKYYNENKKNVDFNNKNIMWIYKITNSVNNKIYIGKTKDIHRRALEYVNEHENNVGKRRLLWKKIKQYGIDKFKMEPIYVTYSDVDAVSKELYFIKKFDSLNPEKGYNVSYQSVKAVNNINAKVRLQKADEKMRRSKMICSINPETKKIYFSTGLKLFGDIIKRHKDEIKSSAKRCTMLEGFFIYYLTDDVFKQQIDFAYDVLNKAEEKTNKNYKYINMYKKFIQMSDNVVDLLCNNTETTKDTVFKEYDIFFVHQDDNPIGYSFSDPIIFINNYKNLKSTNSILYIKKHVKNGRL